jgi:hypothetical protein
LLNDKTYFTSVEKFINLNDKFNPETILEKISLYVELAISPLFTIFQIVFFGKKADIFTVMTVHKTLSVWLSFLEWMQLRDRIREWIKIVRSIGGPFIGCNDAYYHMYVYADGMQRAHDSLFGPRIVSKERTKSL